MPGPDHLTSVEPDGFARMVAGIRTISAAMGDGAKIPVEAERAIAAVARRSLHWARSLSSGTTITAADLVALRPGTGMAPGRAPALVGRRLQRPVAAGTMVDAGDIEGTR